MQNVLLRRGYVSVGSNLSVPHISLHRHGGGKEWIELLTLPLKLSSVAGNTELIKCVLVIPNLLHKLNPSRGSSDFVHKVLTEMRNNSLTKFTEKLLGARRVSQIIPRRGQINATNWNLRVECNLSRVIPTAKHAVEHITVEVADVDRVRSTANDHSESRVGGILLGVVRLEFLDVLKAFV